VQLADDLDGLGDEDALGGEVALGNLVLGQLDVLDGRVIKHEQQITLGGGGDLRREICLGGLKH